MLGVLILIGGMSFLSVRGSPAGGPRFSPMTCGFAVCVAAVAVAAAELATAAAADAGPSGAFQIEPPFLPGP